MRILCNTALNITKRRKVEENASFESGGWDPPPGGSEDGADAEEGGGRDGDDGGGQRGEQGGPAGQRARPGHHHAQRVEAERRRELDRPRPVVHNQEAVERNVHLAVQLPR